jgi:hypothetical protein
MGWSDSPQSAAVDEDKTRAEEIKKLIEQLGSSGFQERQAASSKLEEIGQPALDALRKAAVDNKDSEVRSRAEQAVHRILEKAIAGVMKEGIRLATETKDYEKATITLERAIKLAEERYWPDKKTHLKDDVPILSELHLQLARVYVKRSEFEKAAGAFHFAGYYCGEKRKEIDQEWSKMTDGLLASWDKDVKSKIAQDPTTQQLAAKYSLVILHSRRYAAGGYLRSAYSFIHETSNEKQHGNDVQVLFDNDRVHQNNFQIRMVTNQSNLVIDLGNVDFDKDSDAKKLADQSKKPWETSSCKAVDGHVYLERVRDDRGNDFFVLFKIVALDKDSRYMGFIWRRLPGSE